MLTTLWEGEDPPISGPEKIDAIGHRVVHGGALFDLAVPLDSEVESSIQACAEFAPFHNQNSLHGIQVVKEMLGPKIPQVAVPFRFLGLQIDPDKNTRSILDSNIAALGSTVEVLLIKSQENWQIARETHDCLPASQARRSSPTRPGLNSLTVFGGD